MSTTSSSSVNSFYTSGGTTRLNGSQLMSGLDTQKLIEALTSKTQSKITKQKQSEQKVKWKQEMYREVESLMKTFSDTYFSYASNSTNIQSSTFFDSEDLVSSSSLVSATGAASDAGNVVINSINQLAKAASMNCGNLVSKENITSGTLRDSWTESTVGGKSMVITYAGIDYTVTLSSSVNLDSATTSQQNLQTLADGLNDQIRDTSGLKGNIEFTVANNKLTLKSTDGKSTVKISDYEASKDDTSGKDFLAALGFNPGNSGTSLTSSESINAGGSADNVTSSKLFNQSISSPAYLNVKVGNSTYSFSLGGLDLSSATDPNSAAQKVVDRINKLASETAGLKDTHFTATTTNGKISFSADQTVSVTGGSSHLLDGLGGFAVDSNTATNAVDRAALTKSYFGDTLAGSTVTFNLNGIKKTILFYSQKKKKIKKTIFFQFFF